MAASEASSVTKALWEAAIPVQLRLAEDEVSSLEQPPTLYMLVPRQGYLHSLVPQALRLLQHLLPPGDDAPWFEAGALPLRWGVPAGVLYDLLEGPGGRLPWRLTIHFRSYPSKMLPAYGGEAALRGALFNSLKEAAAVARGSAQRVMEMAAGAQEDLFRQAMASRLPRYRAILAALQLAPAAQRGGPPRVPLRLYLRTTAPGGYLASYEGIAATSRPVAALGAGGEPVSLRQALLPLLEEALLRCGGNGRGGADAAGSAAATGGAQSQPSTPSSATAAAAAAAAAAKGGDAGGGISPSPSADAELPAAPSAEASGSGAAEAAPNDGAGSSSTAAAEQPAAAGVPEAAVDAAADGAAAAGTAPSQATALLEAAAAAGRVLVGGTSPPLDAPLAWLHTNLHAPDYFLYVVAHVPLPC